jgi:hypothetical protein
VRCERYNHNPQATIFRRKKTVGIERKAGEEGDLTVAATMAESNGGNR